MAWVGISCSSVPKGSVGALVVNLCNLHHNIILHISIFIHFCEAYLRILPHFNLFHHLFWLKKRGVRVSDRGVLNQLVKVNCVPLILDGDAKRHKVYIGSGNRRPTSSLGDRSCTLCIEVLVVGGYKLGERGS